jgi:extracellular elastinolytic metalloproteinase
LFISAVEALGIVRDSLDLPIEISQDAETEAIADEKETYAVTNVGNTNEDPKARLVYLVKPNGEVALTWKVETRVQDTAFSSYVDVDASDVVTVLNHVDSFTYEV